MTENAGHKHDWVWSDDEGTRSSWCLVVGCDERRDGWVTEGTAIAKERIAIHITYLDGTTEDIPEADDAIISSLWVEVVMNDRVKEAILFRADGTEASRYRPAVNGPSICDECGCAPGHQRSCSRYQDRAVPRIPAPRPELEKAQCGHVSATFHVPCRHPLKGHNGMHRSTPVLSTDSYCWDDTH